VALPGDDRSDHDLERWDSTLPKATINPDGMTSFNRDALGAVADSNQRRAHPGRSRVGHGGASHRATEPQAAATPTSHTSGLWLRQHRRPAPEV
jgi:hypothetical protein